jgi:hypothetical protein
MHPWDAASSWQSLFQYFSSIKQTANTNLQLTKGFSCCKQRNVENNRGFILIQDVVWKKEVELRLQTNRRSAAAPPLACQDFVGTFKINFSNKIWRRTIIL